MSFYDDLKDFVIFEEETSIVYPWALSSEEILKHSKEIEMECNSNSATEILYAAIEKVCGANPILLK